MDCKRCGGIHYGSNKCPFLDEETCATCSGIIPSEGGSDFAVHPGRAFDTWGRVHHVTCAPPPEQAASKIEGRDDRRFNNWVKQYWPSEQMGSAYAAYRSARSNS